MGGADPCAETPRAPAPLLTQFPAIRDGPSLVPGARWTYLGQQQSEVLGRLCSGPAQPDGGRKWPREPGVRPGALCRRGLLTEPPTSCPPGTQGADGHPHAKALEDKVSQESQATPVCPPGAWRWLPPCFPPDPPALRSPQELGEPQALCSPGHWSHLQTPDLWSSLRSHFKQAPLSTVVDSARHVGTNSTHGRSLERPRAQGSAGGAGGWGPGTGAPRGQVPAWGDERPGDGGGERPRCRPLPTPEQEKRDFYSPVKKAKVANRMLRVVPLFKNLRTS